ncbi:MFS general substrate transporter [Teratosphaeria nubilosa]|uniref:MFS general substrate transporter n=1 Tax=Teratosphaeria nubilosa TaxID=161662 RepID=A0A6G1L7I0_9PEZI|nr:MFS general substrate transporter [Teratosphaeria nubilosa]
MEEEEPEIGHLRDNDDESARDALRIEDPLCQHDDGLDAALERRTVRKLDLVLLPFLALLFLLNSMDKSNIGNAETAGFTHDAGLSARDINISLAYFFSFFVALQPVGAAIGRKYGMARWVPACMSLWGLSTILHIWVKKRWQLICLRIAIASLEAGFYPTTVSYLSLFYTRWEFGVRLSIFYGQTAVAGALGGVLSWAVFTHFHEPHRGPEAPPSTTSFEGGWKSWEVLFLIEGCTTMLIAIVGFFWLPQSADTAWFFTDQEKECAEQRILLDRDGAVVHGPGPRKRNSRPSNENLERHARTNEDEAEGPHQRLLSEPVNSTSDRRRRPSNVSAISVTADTGLSRQDILSALFNYKIWHLLICNILSAIPATAFGVFLPLVMKQLSPALNLSAAASNLLAAPPFVCGAVTLFIFTRWSDHSQKRIMPILWGLGILLVGLTMTLLAGTKNFVLRYISLCILLSGSFIASPLTVAWLTNNTPEPGKRAILLGINGWGNLAGVFSALLFSPDDEKIGYLRPFIITLVCVIASFAGFVSFLVLLVRENKWRDSITDGWTRAEYQREELIGDVRIKNNSTVEFLWRRTGLEYLAMVFGWDKARHGDEKLTFRYGL